MKESPRDSITISHYRILSRLGAGGMGVVYLAEDTTLGRKVALKMLAAEFTGSQDRVWRFVQEAKAASALNHPNITTIYEIGEVEGAHYIATEHIEGETLRQRLTRGAEPCAKQLISLFKSQARYPQLTVEASSIATSNRKT